VRKGREGGEGEMKERGGERGKGVKYLNISIEIEKKPSSFNFIILFWF
jgi:hypothetical protein